MSLRKALAFLTMDFFLWNGIRAGLIYYVIALIITYRLFLFLFDILVYFCHNDNVRDEVGDSLPSLSKNLFTVRLLHKIVGQSRPYF